MTNGSGILLFILSCNVLPTNNVVAHIMLIINNNHPGGEKLWEQNLLITVMYSVPATGILSIVRTVDNKYIKKHQNVKNAVSY